MDEKQVWIEYEKLKDEFKRTNPDHTQKQYEDFIKKLAARLGV